MTLFLKRLIIYGFCLWLLNLGVGYFLSTFESQDLVGVKQFYPAMRWDEYYNRKDSLDVIILGSSHAYRTYDPTVIANGLGKGVSVFNFGSSAQSPKTSYFVLNEVLENETPELVVMDIYFLVFAGTDQLKNGRFNYAYMRKGKGRTDFFRNGFSFEEQIILKLFPAYVYKTYLNGKFNKLLGRNFISTKKGFYQGNGFVSNPDTLSYDKLTNENQFDYFETKFESLAAENLKYLKKIKDRCKEKGIKLVFTTAPMPMVSVDKIKNYQQFHDFFRDLSRNWSIPFYDYNISRMSGLSDTADFYDDDHLNAMGAKKISSNLVGILKQTFKE